MCLWSLVGQPFGRDIVKAAVAVGILCVFLMSDSDVFFSVVSLAGARRLCLAPPPALRTGVGPSCQHPVVFFNRNVQMNSPLYVSIVSLGANQQAPGLKLRWAYYMQRPAVAFRNGCTDSRSCALARSCSSKFAPTGVP